MVKVEAPEDRSTSMRAGFVTAALLVFIAACQSSRPEHAPRAMPDASGAPAVVVSAEQRLANLEALARLYGDARYFHPSDQSAALDWDRFLVHGVSQVSSASSSAVLAEVLDGLIAPIAPTAMVTTDRSRLPSCTPHALPEGAILVAWQHLGPGLDAGARNVYASKRLGRSTFAADADEVTPGRFMTYAGPAAWAGKTVRLRARVRVEGDGDGAFLWLKDSRAADDPDPTRKRERLVRSASWVEAAIEETITAEASDYLVLGGGISGRAAALFDDFEVALIRAARRPLRQLGSGRRGMGGGGARQFRLRAGRG